MAAIVIQQLGLPDLAGVADMLDELGRDRLVDGIGFAPRREDIARITVRDPDVEPDLFLGVRVEGTLAGCVLGVRRPWKAGRETTGYIKGLLVRPAYRGRGVARLLLAECEARLAARGVDTLLFGCCAPWYVMPGIPADDAGLAACFRASGWQVSSERISLVVEHAAGGGAPGVSTVPGVQLAGPSEAGEVLEFVEHHFSRSWAEETRPALRAGTPAFCCVVRDPDDGSVAGFAAVHGTNPDWFGPMGVRPDRRGRGLGGQLAVAAVQEAWGRGAQRLLLPWVNENETFYRRVLGSVTRVLHLKTSKGVPAPHRP